MTQWDRRQTALRLIVVFMVGVDVIAFGASRQKPSRGHEIETAYAAQASVSPMVSRFLGRSIERKSGQGLVAYDHAVSLIVPASQVNAHLTHLRRVCLEMPGCELLSATEDSNERAPGSLYRHAQITARLSHDRIEGYLAAAAAHLPGEHQGDVVTQQFRTNERDLRGEVTDVERRLLQLTAYRDRLEMLEAHSAGKTDDLIKIAKELSEAQTTLEATLREKNDLTRQIVTEEVNVSFESKMEQGSPLGQRWRESWLIFTETAADVLVFVIRMVAWAPLVVIGVLLIRRAVRHGWFSRD